MRITCPNCDSAFQLARGALGATGRKVRCSRCGMVWHATPVSDESELAALPKETASRFPEPSVDEWRAALQEDDTPARPPAAPPDDGTGVVVPFRSPESAAAEAPDPGEASPPGADAGDSDSSGESPVIDADVAGFDADTDAEAKPKRTRKPVMKRRITPPRRMFSSPIILMISSGFVLFVVAGALFSRETVVRMFPDIASLYAVVGLEVNLRGLAFENVATRRELDGSTPVLVIEGVIASVDEADDRPVPPIRFALLSSAGREVYAWTMDPPKTLLTPRDRVSFASRLPAPPEAAVDVQVRFTDKR